MYFGLLLPIKLAYRTVIVCTAGRYLPFETVYLRCPEKQFATDMHTQCCTGQHRPGLVQPATM